MIRVREKQNGRKEDEYGHISQSALPLWSQTTDCIAAGLPLYLLHPRVLLGGIASTWLHPLLHLLSPRNLMIDPMGICLEY